MRTIQILPNCPLLNYLQLKRQPITDTLPRVQDVPSSLLDTEAKTQSERGCQQLIFAFVFDFFWLCYRHSKEMLA
jgi:hypothetical protein